jgi:hypothetical protein
MPAIRATTESINRVEKFMGMRPRDMVTAQRGVTIVMSNTRTAPLKDDPADPRPRELLVRRLIEQLPEQYEEAFGPSIDPDALPTKEQLRAVAARVAARVTKEAGTYEGILREAIARALSKDMDRYFDGKHTAQTTIALFAEALALLAGTSGSEQHVWRVVAAACENLCEYDMAAGDVTFFVTATGLEIVDVAVAVHAAVCAGLLRRWVPGPDEPGLYHPALYELSSA